MTSLAYRTKLELLGPVSSTLSSILAPTAGSTILRNDQWGSHTPYQKSYIIRGIGYKASITDNGWLKHQILQSQEISFLSHFCSNSYFLGDSTATIDDWKLISQNEFQCSRYLTLRVGYSHYTYTPIPDQIGIRIRKKDRKMIIYSSSLNLMSAFAKYIYNFRPPSVYTGRGIRSKGSYPRRKLGKKDVRKGRFF